MSDLRDVIPSMFYRGDEQKPVATNVGELIEILQRLPSDLKLDEDSRVVVYNVKSNPIVSVEDADDFDGEDDE